MLMEVYKFLMCYELESLHWYCNKCNIVSGKIASQMTPHQGWQDEIESKLKVPEMDSEEKFKTMRKDLADVESKKV